MTVGYYALRKFYMDGGIEGELKVNRLQILPIPINQNFTSKKDIYESLNLAKNEVLEITRFYEQINSN